MQLLFRLSRLASCRDQVNEKYDDNGRLFPVAAGRIGQFKGSGSTNDTPVTTLRRLLALWRGRLLACLRHSLMEFTFHAAEKPLSLTKSTGSKTKSCFQGFGLSDANAFRTFDWEIPNCRAIREGVMPALKAARTAFS
jgi:hypothetical protein